MKLYILFIVPERNSSVRALARIKVMLSLPYNWQTWSGFPWWLGEFIIISIIHKIHLGFS